MFAQTPSCGVLDDHTSPLVDLNVLFLPNPRGLKGNPLAWTDIPLALQKGSALEQVEACPFHGLQSSNAKEGNLTSA